MEIEGINEGLPACEEQIEASVKLIQECEARLQEAAEKQKAIKVCINLQLTWKNQFN